jgi:hydroxypyruvate isomerase
VHFAANLTFLWPDLPPHARFEAARAAGFDTVELLFVHDIDARFLEEELARLSLRLHLFDPFPGDWANGDRGLLCDRARTAQLDRAFDEAVDTATRLKCTALNLLVGVRPPGTLASEAFEVAVNNLLRLEPLARAAGLTILVEQLNPIEHPGYLASELETAVRMIEAVGSPAVRLQFDQYHVAMTGGSCLQALKRCCGLIGHVQIADVPGRHEPGTGTQPIAQFLDALDASGYKGAVGLEYIPRRTTTESLEWLHLSPYWHPARNP